MMRIRKQIVAMAAVALGLFAAQAYAGVTVATNEPTADGFNGSIGAIAQNALGTFDVGFYNYQNSNWAFKRAFCGGDVSTYYSAAANQMPTSVGQSTSAGGLTITLVDSWGSLRTYRFSGVANNVPSDFCFVSGDGYNSSTLTLTASTPTPVISNIRVQADTNSVGGKTICVDYRPSNPSITSFDWIENGAAFNGDAAALWDTFICLNRRSALVEGSTFTIQLRYNGQTSVLSNSLTVTVPVTAPPLPGPIATVTATNNDVAIRGQIKINWSAASNATTYNVWRTTGAYAAYNQYGLVATETPPSSGVAYGYMVQGVNAAGVGPWSAVATGVAAPLLPASCSSASASASLVTSATTSVRLSTSGVENANSVLIYTWPLVNGTWGGSTSWAATNGGNGYWYADIPLTSGNYASNYGPFMTQAQMGYANGWSACGGMEVRFTRRAPQAVVFGAPVVAGVGAPSSITLLAGRSYPFSYVATNAGQSTWLPAAGTASPAGHKLSTTNPDNNSTFGFQRVLMPPPSVAPGGSAQVSGTLTGPAGTFTLQVQAIEENLERFGNSANVSITFVGAPTAATGLAATDGEYGDRVLVTWQPGTNITSQTVVRAAAGAAWPTGTLTGLPTGWTAVCRALADTASSCDDTSGVRGTTYSYRAFGFSSASGSTFGGWDQGASSNSDTGFSAAALTTAPVLTSVTSNLAGSINVTWAAYIGAASFLVARDPPQDFVPAPSGATTTYSDTDVLRGGSRCYVVRAVNVAGVSPWSNRMCGTRLGLTPTALSASKGTVTGATRLTWGAPSGYTAATSELWRLVSVVDPSSWEQLVVLSGSPGAWDDVSARGIDVAVDFYVLHQVDAQGNRTSMTFTSPSATRSANVADGYANIAPSAITIPTISAVSNANTTPVALVVTDANAQAGQAENFTWFASNPTTGATAGTCSISSGNLLQWSPPADFTFSGPRVCVVTVTDKGGASLSAEVSFVVQAYIPGAPVAVSATDGTVTGKVNVTWTTVPTSTYLIFRDNVQIGTSVTNAYSDSTAASTTSYAYSVRAVATAGGQSPMSATDAGYANQPPTSSSTTFTVTVTPGAATNVTPTVVDPNATAGQTESYTFAIVSQLPAGKGAVSVVGGALRYTAPTLIDFTGSQTFVYSVTDKGGATINATGAVVMPELDRVIVVSTLTAPAISVGIGSTFGLGGTYKNDGNTTWVSPAYQLVTVVPQGSGFGMSGATPTMPTTAPGQSAVLRKDLTAPQTIGVHDIVVGVARPASSASPIAASTTISVNVVAPVDCGIASVYTEAAVVTTITGSLRVTGSNIAGAESVRFRVYTAGDGGLTKEYTGAFVGGAWTGSIDLAEHQTGSPRFGYFKVEAWVTKAPFADKVCATGGFRREFPSPPDVTATQGTQTGAVGVSWGAIPPVSEVSPSGYVVLRCGAAITVPVFDTSRTTPIGCVLVGIVGGSATAFTDTLPDATEIKYRYSVAAVEGPLSHGALGWKNLPPVGATLASTVSSRGNPSVLAAPVGGDPNPADVLTYALGVPRVESTTSALGANITINAAGLFVYTPNVNAPLLTEMGVDSFQFFVIDKVGASAPAVAALSVCPSASVFSVTATASPLITASGLVSRLSCNGAVTLGWTAVRVGDSATAGASLPGTPDGVNVADPARVTVSGTNFYSVVALAQGLATTSGLYAIRANVIDVFGAKATSEPIQVDVPCAAPLLSFGTTQANHKTSTALVSSTVRETDVCQRGATYRVIVKTPLPGGALRSADASVSGSNPIRTITSYGLGEINQPNNTAWVAEILRAAGQRTVDLVGFNATRETARFSAPLAINCPGNQVLGGNLWAQSNQTMYALNMALPICAPEEIISLMVDGVEYPADPRDAALLAETRSATFVFTVPQPPEDGPRTLQLKRTPVVSGSPMLQSMTVVYDSRTVTPLYNITGGGAGNVVNSLGRLVLTPRTQ